MLHLLEKCWFSKRKKRNGGGKNPCVGKNTNCRQCCWRLCSEAALSGGLLKEQRQKAGLLTFVSEWHRRAHMERGGIKCSHFQSVLIIPPSFSFHFTLSPCFFQRSCSSTHLLSPALWVLSLLGLLAKWRRWFKLGSVSSSQLVRVTLAVTLSPSRCDNVCAPLFWSATAASWARPICIQCAWCCQVCHSGHWSFSSVCHQLSAWLQWFCVCCLALLPTVFCPLSLSRWLFFFPRQYSHALFRKQKHKHCFVCQERVRRTKRDFSSAKHTWYLN